MTESLEVIALISGGKDSFFSLLHCIQNGHKVVALGNVHPAADTQSADFERGSNQALESEVDEHDLNSFMYQTVGHTVVPLYQQALGIPLYRQPIVGSAIQTAMSYGRSDVGPEKTDASNLGSTGERESSQSEEEDETESLMPLLKRIMADHPGVNALSTGAILSTYQRTRIESVAIRLGLIPLAYLWQYPNLPPGTQSSLLEDMHAVGLEARIVKVASGGLDESVLWGNVTNKQVILRIERPMKRFGTYGDGAVLGEGGEFETLVLDGPPGLFKGRIEVQDNDRRIMREGGGSSWLQIHDAKVIMKDSVEDVKPRCRIPDLLEPRFSIIFDILPAESETIASPAQDNPKHLILQNSDNQKAMFSLRSARQNTGLHWTVTAGGNPTNRAIADEAGILIEEIKQRLQKSSLQPTNITSTVIILRSMHDFASVNKVPPAHTPISSFFPLTQL
jgi:diphthine-ammonia ligase